MKLLAVVAPLVASRVKENKIKTFTAVVYSAAVVYNAAVVYSTIVVYSTTVVYSAATGALVRTTGQVVKNTSVSCYNGCCHFCCAESKCHQCRNSLAKTFTKLLKMIFQHKKD